MDIERLWRGFGWGVVATVAMSVLMILGMLSGRAPMPAPIPAAIVGQLTGGGLPQPAQMAVAAILHLGYGGFWGGARLLPAQPAAAPEYPADGPGSW